MPDKEIPLTTAPASESSRQSARPIAVSILVPLMDETVSLSETVHSVMNENGSDIHEVICVVSKFTTREALAVASELENEYPGIVFTRCQERPFLGGALQDAFAWSTGSHILLMASDLETDPKAVRPLIATARQGWDIVATTRWNKGGSFAGYNPVKFVANWIFQKAIGALYRTSLTDLTFGYRIWRAEFLRNHEWTELRHPFLLECLLRPLLRGARATEIPVHWVPRKEGESHNPFWRNFLYFRIAFKLRFERRHALPVRGVAEANR